MPTIVEVNGTEVEFPDGMSVAEISQILPRLNRYGQFDIGGPLRGNIGVADTALNKIPGAIADALNPFAAYDRFKSSAKPQIKPDLMGGVQASITDPYGVAMESAALAGLGLDWGDLVRLGAKAGKPAMGKIANFVSEAVRKPTAQDALSMKAEMMFDPKGIDFDEIIRRTGWDVRGEPKQVLPLGEYGIARGQWGAVGTAQGSQLGKTGASRPAVPITGPQEGVKTGQRVSTASPTKIEAEKIGFHSRDDINIDLEEMLRNPKAFAANMELVRGYPSVPTRARNPKNIANYTESHIKDNLLFLRDNVPVDFWLRSGNWYKGANALANDITNAYDVPVEASAGVLARLSPGMDWLQNVEQADRLVSIWRNQQDTVLPDAAYKMAQQLNKGSVAHLKGKRLGDLTSNIDKAKWIRAFDESTGNRLFYGLTPEGAVTDVQRAKTGDTKSFMWQSYDNIAKAINMLEEPTTETISRNLGQGHKIRNFYNNIVNPFDPLDVTVDTHAVSAGLLTPYSQKGVPVGHAFGGGAIPGEVRGSAKSGYASGTYGLYADAYRRAAEEIDLLPQTMQSPAWEIVRETFPTTGAGKAKVQALTDQIWQDVRAGKMTADEARKKIVDAAGGIKLPSWYTVE